MRTKMVAGNWKMNKTLQEGVALATELKEQVKNPACAVVIGTPFIHLATVAELLKDSPIQVAAENCADKEKGAYTGEVSAAMVKSTGATYCILGHSERRAYYHEDYAILREKVQLALANGLEVIFCIGEVKEEREAGKQNEVVKAQLEGSVFNLTAEEWSHITLAYGEAATLANVATSLHLISMRAVSKHCRILAIGRYFLRHSIYPQHRRLWLNTNGIEITTCISWLLRSTWLRQSQHISPIALQLFYPIIPERHHQREIVLGDNFHLP